MTRDEQQEIVLRRRVLTKGGITVNKAVSTSATALAVTWRNMEPDGVYAVLVTPNWNTTVWVTGKSQTGCTINFGTAAPGSATVDLAVFRSE